MTAVTTNVAAPGKSAAPSANGPAAHPVEHEGIDADHRHAVVAAGVDWYGAGACVLPVATDGSKAPDPRRTGTASKWDRYKTQRPDLASTLAMINGADGIGVVTGTVSGRLGPV
jgi:hypothetical protein